MYWNYLTDFTVRDPYLVYIAAQTTSPIIIAGGVSPSIQLTPEKTILLSTDLRGAGTQRPSDGNIDPNFQTPLTAGVSSLHQNEPRPPSEQQMREAIAVATEEDRDDWEEDDIVDEPDDDSEDSYYEATYRKRKRSSAKACLTEIFLTWNLLI